mmetsp:Transcript_76539/g.169131  ORF Transcript_76539/g.169131 Transcript_76539/m.169131 type:complete len:255 (+) Transcript_76539:238-1002(+)
MSEENKVALIVEGDCPSALKVRPLREQGGQLPRQSSTQASNKLIQDQLRVVTGVAAGPALHLLTQLQSSDTPVRGGPFGQVRDVDTLQHLGFLMEEHHICEVSIAGVLANLLERKLFAWVVETVGDDANQLLQERVHLSTGFLLGGHQDLRFLASLEILLKFVHCLIFFYLTIISRDNGLVRLPHLVDGAGFLTFHLFSSSFRFSSTSSHLGLLLLLLLLHELYHLRPFVLIFDVFEAGSRLGCRQTEGISVFS